MTNKQKIQDKLDEMDISPSDMLSEFITVMISSGKSKFDMDSELRQVIDKEPYPENLIEWVMENFVDNMQIDQPPKKIKNNRLLSLAIHKATSENPKKRALEETDAPPPTPVDGDEKADSNTLNALLLKRMQERRSSLVEHRPAKLTKIEWQTVDEKVMETPINTALDTKKLGSSDLRHLLSSNKTPSPIDEQINHSDQYMVSTQPDQSLSTETYGYSQYTDSSSSIPCKFGFNCLRPDCKFSHPSPVSYMIQKTGQDKSTIPCRFNISCLNTRCPYLHSTPKTTMILQECRYQPFCKNPNCPYQHNGAQETKPKENKRDRAFAVDEDKTIRMTVMGSNIDENKDIVDNAKVTSFAQDRGANISLRKK